MELSFSIIRCEMQAWYSLFIYLMLHRIQLTEIEVIIVYINSFSLPGLLEVIEQKTITVNTKPTIEITE